MSEGFEQEAEYTITDLDALKVISDPFRIQILEHMVVAPTTVKQVAEELGVKPNKLYYHVNLLEKHGLIALVETQVVSGIIEKWYQSRARSFALSREMLDLSEDPIGDAIRMITGVIDASRSGIIQAVEAGLVDLDASPEEFSERDFVVARSKVFLTEEQRVEFLRRYEALLEEFNSGELPPPPDTRPYSLTFVFHPQTQSPEGDEQ